MNLNRVLKGHQRMRAQFTALLDDDSESPLLPAFKDILKRCVLITDFTLVQHHAYLRAFAESCDTDFLGLDEQKRHSEDVERVARDFKRYAITCDDITNKERAKETAKEFESHADIMRRLGTISVLCRHTIRTQVYEQVEHILLEGIWSDDSAQAAFDRFQRFLVEISDVGNLIAGFEAMSDIREGAKKNVREANETARKYVAYYEDSRLWCVLAEQCTLMLIPSGEPEDELHTLVSAGLRVDHKLKKFEPLLA